MWTSNAQFIRRSEVLENARLRAHFFTKKLERVENQFAFFRFAATLALLAIVATMFEHSSPGKRVLEICGLILAFVIASGIHKRLKKSTQKWQSLETSYTLSQLRLKRNFSEIQAKSAPWHQSIASNVPQGHPYATDLDIATNLFTFLDTCSTQPGAKKLFDALLNAGIEPIETQTRQQRQSRLKILARDSSFLREHEIVRMDTELIARHLQLNNIESQSEISKVLSGNKILPFVAMVCVGIFAWVAILIPSILKFARNGSAEELYHSLILYAAIPVFGALLFKPLVDYGTSIQQRTIMLEFMLLALQKYKNMPEFANFSCLRGQALQTFARLKTSLNLISIRNNPVLWLAIHAIFPYDSVACALLFGTSRKIARELDAWEKEIAEFDLTCAFARFQWENPHCCCFEKTSTHIIAENMGHPLLSPLSLVRNDFQFTHENPVVLLTGSNMSGKSTFLRTLGVNTLFFNMGAPVCASSFSSPFMRLLCAIRVDDSLADGMSYFYAEIKRLKTILVALEKHEKEKVPALFLVDEIFRGTNNKERFVGSWSILHTLLDSKAFGVVSTHDLALTQLEQHDARMRNQHFREHIENDVLVFDYKIKDGPCPTTNALAIMKAEGLPVLELAPN